MTPILLPVAELKSALSGLGKVISPKATLAVIKHVKIERTADGWIALTGTDLDRFVTVRFEHPAEGPPACVLVPYEQLLQTVKNCGKNEQLQIIPDTSRPAIRFALGNQTGESKIKPVPVAEFPSTPRIQSESIPLPADLRRSFQEAMACSSSDETRYVLNGTFIDVRSPKGSYIVATDGKHLYSANSFTLPLKQSALIPSHKFLGWKDFLMDGEWQIKANADLVQIRSRRWRFVARQIQGPYPDWHAAVPNPETAKTHLTLNPDHLESVAKLIHRLPNHDDRYQSLGLKWDGKEVCILAKDSAGDAWMTIPIQEVQGQGPAQTIMFDRRFLIKALQYGLNQISLIDECSPLRIHAKGRQMIVMPVRPEGQVAPVKSTARPVEIPSRSPSSNPQPSSTTTPKPMLNRPAPTPNSPSADTAPIIEEALTLCGALRDRCQEGLNQIRDLAMKLKLIQREQKTNAREMSSVRSTLRTLQGLKL